MWRPPASLRMIGMGGYIAFCIAGGVLGGHWLDETVKTLPLFTLLGLFLGLIAAFVGLYRMVQRTVDDIERDERREQVQREQDGG